MPNLVHILYGSRSAYNDPKV